MPSRVGPVRFKQNNLQTIRNQMHAEAGRRLQSFGLKLKVRWQQSVPVVTGEYFRSIQFEMVGETSGNLLSTAKHSVYLEFGTRYISARYYALRVIEESRREFIETFRNLI